MFLTQGHFSIHLCCHTFAISLKSLVMGVLAVCFYCAQLVVSVEGKNHTIIQYLADDFVIPQ